MQSAPLNVIAVVLVALLALVCAFVSEKGSQMRLGAKLGVGGFFFLSFAAAIAWVAGYAPAEIQDMFLLRQTRDSVAIADSVVVGYALLIGAAVRVARAWLVRGDPHDA